MKTYYVATLARYVLVEAEDETAAREVGCAALHALNADTGRKAPIEVRIVRDATDDEIEMWKWHHSMLAKDSTSAIPCEGDRIRLLAMHDDPDPIQVGQLGTVLTVSKHGGGSEAWYQVDVAWDNGRTLMLVCPPDKCEVVQAERRKRTH